MKRISKRDILHKTAKGFIEIDSKDELDLGTRVRFDLTGQEGEIIDLEYDGDPNYVHVTLDGEQDEKRFKLSELSLVG